MVDAPQDKPARTSLLQSLKFVAWSFVGIRSKKGYQEDLSKVNPIHLVVVGLVTALVIVIGLIGLVNWVVAK